MVIMDIRLLTGHVANNVDQLRSQSSLVKRVDSDESKIVLYLDEVRIFAAFNVHYVLECKYQVKFRDNFVRHQLECLSNFCNACQHNK